MKFKHGMENVTQLIWKVYCNKSNSVHAELQAKWTKETWKTFEEILDEAETCLLRPNSWRMMIYTIV
jgi:hypothetical protein